MKVVNQPLRKKDAMQLVTGQPVYVDDVTPRDCLCVKLLRSPHANAIVKSINKTAAMKVPGMEAIFTWEDVDQDGRRYTQAGQTYPEASPYDRLVIDRHVRFVGDVVAILAGADEKCVDKAMKLVKVEYEVLEPVLDFHTAKDNPVLVHPEDNWESLAPVGADNKRNLCAHDECGNGDIDAVLADCDVVIDHVYHTQACQQAMMETFRTYCEIDTYGRLHIISSTQIVFHTRRIVANALHIPKSKVRVTKPRIGGGFGAKQTAVSAVYPAFVTWMTKKPSKIIFSRVESQIASSPRHEMEMHVRLGANKDGIVRGIDESSHKVEIGTGKALPLTNLRRIFAGIHHFARSALDVEHQRRHAGLPALVHIITDRIGVTEAHPVGRTVEPHQFGFHPLGGTPAAGRTCRGKGQQAYSQQFFHEKLKAIFVCSFRKYRLRPHGKDRPPHRSAARIRAA